MPLIFIGQGYLIFMTIEHLVIIGGGTAGIAAAMEATTYDIANITLIEKHKLGGECANYACVPAKTWLTAASYLRESDTAFDRLGIELSSEPKFNIDKFLNKQHDIIHDGNYSIESNPKVTIKHGAAAFVDQHTVMVDNEPIKADKFIIATGTTPNIPDIPGLNDINYLTFQDIASLQHLPNSMAIIGSGAVAYEYAYVMSALGVKVTIVSRSDLPLRGFDGEVRHKALDELNRWGVNYIGNANVSSLHKASSGIDITIDGQTFSAETLLVAAGSLPRTDCLKLDNTHIKINPESQGIVVNQHLQTDDDHIYAIGDVLNTYKFTHVADRQAIYAVRHMAGVNEPPLSYKDLGWSLYTKPEVTHVGITEDQAKEQGVNYKSIIISSDKVSRYRIEGEKDSFVKVIVDTDTHTLLGAHAIASHSDDWLHLVSIAISQQLTIDKLLDTYYMYPSKAQLLQKALEEYYYGVMRKH